eukprot:TRINITY_DN7926_c0_g1_i1.p1 TRINITY_DN7926_c0_g1~~TRINITY_DN7926_c0_g1_i1.p1  ORF type:complete len:269 (+),score=71.17 TRINITY_DN7926_c0_g1_i1:56-808(+)
MAGEKSGKSGKTKVMSTMRDVELYSHELVRRGIVPPPQVQHETARPPFFIPNRCVVSGRSDLPLTMRNSGYKSFDSIGISSKPVVPEQLTYAYNPNRYQHIPKRIKEEGERYPYRRNKQTIPSGMDFDPAAHAPYLVAYGYNTAVQNRTYGLPPAPVDTLAAPFPGYAYGAPPAGPAAVSPVAPNYISPPPAYTSYTPMPAPAPVATSPAPTPVSAVPVAAPTYLSAPTFSAPTYTATAVAPAAAPLATS